MNKLYDYYVEPCQLCLTRGGATYRSCGWCHDSDTHYKETDGTYPGDWVALPFGGDGYPFHELPHETRKYYKSGEYLDLSEGKTPSEISAHDAETAVTRNSSADQLYTGLMDGSVRFSSRADTHEQRQRKHLALFVDKYYNLPRQELAMDGGDALPKGKFDQFTLGVTMSGIGDQFIEMGKTVMSALAEEFGDDDIQEFDVSSLVERFPDFKQVLIGQELTAHEYFHVFQTLTTSSAYKLYEVSREISYLRLMAFLIYVTEGGRYDLNNDKDVSVLHYIEKIQSDEEKENLMRLFETARNNVDVIDNFFRFNDAADIQVVDLFEGAAFTYQKLVNRSVSVDTFKAPPQSRYSKARELFEVSGGEDPLLFLVFCHVSLQYGVLDDGDFMELMPTPQSIFSHLCASIESLEYKEPTLFNSKPFASPLASEVLKSSGHALTVDDVEFIDSLQLTDELVQIFDYSLSAYNRVLDETRHLFDSKKVTFKQEPIRALDDRLSAVRTAALRDYPNLDEPLFFIAMLISPEFGQRFILQDVRGYLNTTYVGLMNRNVTATQEDAAYSVMNDVDQLLRSPTAYCCDQHQSAGYSTIIKCENEGGLKRRVIELFGIDIKTMFT